MTVSVTPPTELLSASELEALLATDATAHRVMEKGSMPQPGDLVGVRLNLNVLKSTGKAVQTLHAPTNQEGYKRNRGFYKGEAVGYAQAVVLRDAFFNVNQGGREAIADGRHHKFAMASIDGTLVSLDAPNAIEGLEISFNPRTQHLFVDGQNQAIRSAEEVVVLGHRAYARGEIVYHTEATAPKRAGTFPSQTQLAESEPAPSRSARRMKP